MTTKRIIIILAIIVGIFCSALIGKLILLSNYRQKANVALFLSGDYKKAIEYYDKILYWQPDAVGYYYNRGDAYYKDGQYEKAISDYDKALQLGTEDSLQSILRIALTAKHQGHLKIEEKYLNRLLKSSKGNKENEIEIWAANYHLGQLEFKKGNYRQAISYYNTAHATSPTDLEIYHRANAYFALGQLDSAQQDLKQSLSFVKSDFVKENPNSILATCDTCAFPFGSREYELLTEPNGETIIQSLEKIENGKQIEELVDKLKSTEENNR